MFMCVRACRGGGMRVSFVLNMTDLLSYCFLGVAGGGIYLLQRGFQGQS